MSKNALIISGHPALTQSLANRTILDTVIATRPETKIRYLDRLYPNFQIDVMAEQRALLDADIVIFQFPFHWYALPALMKKWLDDVFLHGFAHGSSAKLNGKKLILSFTTGAPAETYGRNALMQHTIEDYLAPLKSTAILCHLDLQPPIYTCGISYLGRTNIEGITKQQALAQQHAKRLITAIETI